MMQPTAYCCEFANSKLPNHRDQVVFVNNDIWTGNEVWTPLAQAPSCNKVLQEPELCKQYAIEFGCKKGRMHSIQRDLFICACGAINRLDEEKCHQCGMPKEKLLNFDKNELQKNCQIRLEKEEAERLRRAAEQERKKQEHRKLAKKLLKIDIPLIIVLLVCGFSMDKYQELDSEYQDALSQMEEEDYETAIKEFKALGNFKDSHERIKEAQDAIDKEKADTYKEAKALLEAGDASGAKYKFDDIPGYKDADGLCAIAEEQSKVNIIFCGQETSIDEYINLNNKEIQEVMQGAWVLVVKNGAEPITITDNKIIDSDNEIISKWEIVDDQIVFYYPKAESVEDLPYNTVYDVTKGSKEGYYFIRGFEIYKILLPVDSEYVKRLQAYIASEEE